FLSSTENRAGKRHKPTGDSRGLEGTRLRLLYSLASKLPTPKKESRRSGGESCNASPRSPHKRLIFLQRIHAAGRMIDQPHLNSAAFPQPTQLFEPFRFLKGTVG